MNYKEQVNAMINHLSQNSGNDDENVFQLVQALGVGIATVSLIVHKAQRDDFLQATLDAIRDDFRIKCVSFDALVAASGIELPDVDDAVRRDH